jgi:hypothetical protein
MFEKGKSGNPGGRPKALREVEEVARQHTPMAIRTLATIAKDEDAPPAARVSAATTLLDRAWGKPAQTIHAKHSAETDPAELTDEQLANIASPRGNGAAATAAGAGKPPQLH